MSAIKNNLKIPHWQLDDAGGITWKKNFVSSLPHSDHIAMSGQCVDMILEWQVSAQGAFSATRVIRWPMLRTIPDDTKATLQEIFLDNKKNRPVVSGAILDDGTVEEINIHGLIEVKSKHSCGVTSNHIIFPSTLSPAIIDVYELTNNNLECIEINISSWRKEYLSDIDNSLWGVYRIEEFIIGEGYYNLASGETISYAVIHTANIDGYPSYYGNPSAELAARKEFVKNIESNLVLETPAPILNRLFAFSKIRAAESIFATRGGLMHAPGGYNKYLAAIWANDQAEYINPFFPFLGYHIGNESALNAFRHFGRFINSEYKAIPSSIIAEGRDIWQKDRGDAAMIAYGATRFCLASGNKEWCRELWPLIEWCLEYTRRQKNEYGVINSQTDELEGRFPAGDANLCTSTLFYDALISATYLLKYVDRLELEESFIKEAKELKSAINKYFSANVQGYETYQYYQGNDTLRSWICMPLAMGITERSQETIDALLSSYLWTEAGLLTESGTSTVWDRSTLYAMRGIIAAGSVDKCIKKLCEFSRYRLLGKHVPYVIEAYPEQNQSHLSAESGLYCRIFIEGILGIRPAGLSEFEMTPNLPSEWEKIALKNICSFGRVWNLTILKKQNNIQVLVTNKSGKILYNQTKQYGKIHYIKFFNDL